MNTATLERECHEDPGLHYYLEIIQTTKPLSSQEERELARSNREGDKLAFHQLIDANLHLVIEVAQNYLDYGLSYMDLVAEGTVGLIRAIRRFDERDGINLAPYAKGWISLVMEKAIADQVRAKVRA
jgi:RNA polymerase primary sigma factor